MKIYKFPNSFRGLFHLSGRSFYFTQNYKFRNRVKSLAYQQSPEIGSHTVLWHKEQQTADFDAEGKHRNIKGLIHFAKAV